MPHAVCPQCDEEIYLPGSPDIGDIVRCRTCEARLEVVNLHPIELDWPWEADDDEEDEDEFADGFQVWREGDEYADDDDDEDFDDDLDDDDDGPSSLDYTAYDDDEDFAHSRIKHLDD